MRYPGAVWNPSQNYWAGRGGITARWIILHGTAGPNAVAWLCSPDNTDSSAHFVITVDGTIHQLVDTDDTAWGNGVLEEGHDPWWSTDINPNLQTISIEHEKLDLYNNNQITAAQEKSSLLLVTWLCQHYKIPNVQATASGGITGHFSISPKSRAHCPGTFPWSEYFAALQKGTTTVTIPEGWHDDGTTLTAPNSIPVVRGFRDLVLANGATWGKDNWPLEMERAAVPLERSNPGLGNGTQQIFRLCELGWNSSRGVMVEYVGQELLFYRALVAVYEAQIASLTAQLQNTGTAAQSALQQINTITKPFIGG